LDLVGLLRLIKKTGTVLDAVGASIGASDNAVGEGIFLGAVGASVRASDNVGGEGISLGAVGFSIGTLSTSVRAGDNVRGEGFSLGDVTSASIVDSDNLIMDSFFCIIEGTISMSTMMGVL